MVVRLLLAEGAAGRQLLQPYSFRYMRCSWAITGRIADERDEMWASVDVLKRNGNDAKPSGYFLLPCNGSLQDWNASPGLAVPFNK